MTTRNALALGCLILFSGCTSSILQTSKSVLTAPMSLVSSRSARPTSKILALWEPSDGTGLDGRPSRGIAGQVMFFTYGKASPVKTAGNVNVSVYSDFDEDNIDREPAHVFRFSQDAWEAHRTEGTLGQTYNLFIPCDVAGESERIGVRIEHIGADGRTVNSPFTAVTLAAKASSKAASGIRRDIGRQTTSSTQIIDKRTSQRPFQKEDAPVSAVEQLDTLTISLPK